MKAALLHGAHDFRVEELPPPDMQEDECLIAVNACGVCHSEIHQWEKKNPNLEYPRFIGHEVAGIVLDTGSKVKDFQAGNRVAVWVDGKGYAEQVNVKENHIFHVANDIPFDQAMAEPIGCTTNGVMKTKVTFL